MLLREVQIQWSGYRIRMMSVSFFSNLLERALVMHMHTKTVVGRRRRTCGPRKPGERYVVMASVRRWLGGYT